jgi:type 1 glutamine amidotransferase
MKPETLTRRAMLKRSAHGIGALTLAAQLGAAVPGDGAKRILILVGPSTHPPGTHEVLAGGRLMQTALRSAPQLRGVAVDVTTEWPQSAKVREAVGTLVCIGDIFPAQRLPDSPLVLAQIGEMMQRGCGLVCVHYATGLRAVDVTPEGGHPLLGWLGGYFATKCPHHQSVAKVFPKVTIAPEGSHPLTRGWREFSLPEEPYYNNWFGPGGNKLAPNVTAIATSPLPPEAPQREVVAWAVERADSGRGFGVVMPHFYKSWANDDLRMLVMNGIAWTAKFEVPAAGIATATPDLAAHGAESVEPRPRPPAKKTG